MRSFPPPPRNSQSLSSLLLSIEGSMTHDAGEPIDTRRPTPEGQNEQFGRLASDNIGDLHFWNAQRERSRKIVEIGHSTHELIVEGTTRKGE